VTRSVASSIFGLLLLHLLGDEEIRTRWEELPATVTKLVFDSLLPEKGPKK
jgi:hypothetical protein